MKMKQTKQMAIVIMGLLGLVTYAYDAEAKTVRATEITAQLWSQYEKGEIQELVVEFRQGDILPVTLGAEGDLLETTQSQPSYVTIKKAFWLKMLQNQVLLSMNGVDFQEFKDLITGSLTAGASSDSNGGVANGINVLFKAFLK
jgi:hypothetical protein